MSEVTKNTRNEVEWRREGGVEPLSNKTLPIDDEKVTNSSTPHGTAIGTQTTGITCPILAKVVKDWNSLSEDTKKAIRAIAAN